MFYIRCKFKYGSSANVVNKNLCRVFMVINQCTYRILFHKFTNGDFGFKHESRSRRPFEDDLLTTKLAKNYNITYYTSFTLLQLPYKPFFNLYLLLALLHLSLVLFCTILYIIKCFAYWEHIFFDNT